MMSKMLLEHDDINFVYCENDNEAFGAIDAIRDAGKTVGPGGDIQIILLMRQGKVFAEHFTGRS